MLWPRRNRATQIKRIRDRDHPFIGATICGRSRCGTGCLARRPFSIVGYLWFGSREIAGHPCSSPMPGAIVLRRSYALQYHRRRPAGLLNIAFLARGKSFVGVAVLGATLLGVLTLPTTVPNIALITDALLLAPMLAGVLIMGLEV